MRASFEGYTEARKLAETESRKNNKELFVIKTNRGGIRYEVCPQEELQTNDKILVKYKNGQIVK